MIGEQKMNNRKLGRKFWVTLVIFSLMGQVAWVVENMYFNVFIYKMFHASAANISLMVSASAVAATLTTLLIGALSDKVGKRKIFICGGYILWGAAILSFALIRMDILTPLAGSTTAAASLGVTLVILMDCVMTFFGSAANDASFNAWLTDSGDETNRGRIEGINSMMPLVAILVVFGGFMAFDLDKQSSWTTIYLIIGISMILIGMLGFFLIKDCAVTTQETKSYWKNVLYSFRISVIKKNKLLYAVIGAFAIFGISIQIFMPYLILYYEKTLGMDNYVLIMAPAIILAAVITAFYGKLYDMMGFNKSVIPTVVFLMAGYVFLFFGRQTLPVFAGSLFMMTGYLTGMAIFGAMIRDHIPEDKAGLFQGLRIFGQVFVPGIIGPAIGAMVLRNADRITNNDGTTSFLPNQNIYLAAFIAAVVLLLALSLIFEMIRKGHYELNTNLEIGWEEYPRPQLKRESFLSLNGIWKLNHRQVRVPFAPQSVLAGYHMMVSPYLTYRREFEIPEGFVKDQVLLHFGAVDQVAEIFIDGEKVCHHEGGYLPFEVDITRCLHIQKVHQLEVKVKDTLSHTYPYGKQRKNRGGMWYTPISGIWQSVWLESVDEIYIQKLKITPQKAGKIVMEVDTNAKEYEISLELEPGFSKVWKLQESKITLDLEDLKREDGTDYKPQYWTPENPYLYTATLQAEKDKVETYFALRHMSIEKIGETDRICLNGKPIFLHGVLDQGYFCDGIYLPANESGYEQDILNMKELGFNMLRKHIKVEPESFYYACDRLGMLVMQDMVNSGHYSFIRDTAFPTLGKKVWNDRKIIGNKKRKAFFEKHMEETIEHLYNHPCIVAYTIFNEGWGQFDSDRMYEKVKKLDSTRVVDSTSGWFAQKYSDVESLHVYFNPIRLYKSKKPLVVSECGGYSYMEKEHIYSKYGQYGYGNCKSKEELTEKICQMYERMILPSISEGLCGCVYTQLSDVEDEINGLYTYDRLVCKVDKEKMLQMSQRILALGKQDA